MLSIQKGVISLNQYPTKPCFVYNYLKLTHFIKCKFSTTVRCLLFLVICFQALSFNSVFAQEQAAASITNNPPSAQYLNFSGHFRASVTIYATYDYIDAEGDPEQGTQIRWYRSDDVNGTNKQELAANVTSYWLQEADIGKFISFEVTPSDEFGPGATASIIHPEVVEGFIPPVATNVSFTGMLREGELLTPVYTFSDANGDEEYLASLESNPAGTIFNWYASDDSTGSNKTLIQSLKGRSTLTLQSSMVNKFISFEVVVSDVYNYFGVEGYSYGEPVESSINAQEVEAFPDVYLTEIMYQEQDFLEWFNFESSATDISNWQIYRLEYDRISRHYYDVLVLTIEEGTVIPAGGCLLLTSATASEFNQAWGATPSHCLLYDTDRQNYASGSGYPSISDTGATYFRLRTSANVDVTLLSRSSNATGWPALDGASSLYLNLQLPQISAGVPARDINAQQWANTTAKAGGVLSAPGVFVSGEQALASPFRFFYPAAVPVAQSDQPPTASNLTIVESGTAPRSLLASYDYADSDGEIDSHSVYAWYRATRADGADKQRLTGEDQLTYLVSGEDINHYLIFEVTPGNVAGNGNAVQSSAYQVSEIQNAVPVASNLAIDGPLRAGFTLNFTYTYTDSEGNPETGSTVRWFRSDDASGSNKQQISDATTSAYQLQLDDIGKFISAEVTPADSFGQGAPVESDILSTAVDGFDPPVANNVGFSGKVEVGRVLTGHYDFFDPNGDPEYWRPSSNALPGTNYQWYMSDNADGRNKQLLQSRNSDTLLTVREFMLGKYLSFEVTPADRYTYFDEVRSSLGEPVESSLAQTVPVAPLPKIILTEINFNSPSGNYIEIFNFNEYDVDVSNWLLWRATTSGHFTLQSAHTVEQGTVIPAGGCLIFTEMSAVEFSNAWGEKPSNCTVLGDSRALFYSNTATTRYLRLSNEVGFNVLELDTSLMNTENGWPEINAESSVFLNKQISQILVMPDNVDQSGDQWLQSANITGLGRLSFAGALPGGQEISSPYQHFGGDATQSAGDTPPVASAVTITPTVNNQNSLTGSYVYQDTEQDLEILSVYAWYRSDFVDGSNRQVIDGANGQVYNLVQEDIGKYIIFAITPRNRLALGSTVFSLPFLAQIQATAPTVSDLNITGIFRAAQTIYAQYSYSDAEGDADQSSIKWYRSDDTNGTNKTEIIGATDFQYQLQTDDIGKFMSFEITPTDVLNTTGESVESAIFDSAIKGFTPPVASNVMFSGSLQMAEVLTGSYQYSDAEGDPEVFAVSSNFEPGTTYNWYQSDTPTGQRTLLKSSKFDQTLTLTHQQIGKYISFEVIPVDTYNNFGFTAYSEGEPASSPLPVSPVPEFKNLILTEIMYNSLTPYTGRYAQYLEWFNFYQEAIDISGWVFQTPNSGAAYTVPANTVIPAGGCLVMTNADSPERNEFVSSWGNKPDNCVLIGPQNTNTSLDYFWNLSHFYLPTPNHAPVYSFRKNGVYLVGFSLSLDNGWPENIQGRSIQLSIPLDEVLQKSWSELASGSAWRISEDINGIAQRSAGVAVNWWNNNQDVGSPFTYLGGAGEGTGSSAVPVAAAVQLTGTMVNRQSINIQYEYADSGQNPEVTTQIRIYGYDNPQGDNRTLITTLDHIAAGNDASYTFSENDIGKYISAEVIPGNRNTRGTAVASSITPIAVRSLELGLNIPPIIEGSPAESVLAGESYQFTPQASDADSLHLSFEISNQPSWSSFNSQTGELSGTPATTDRGSYQNIIISVNDGLDSTSLPAFDIEVTALNVAPTAEAGNDQSVNEGTTVSLSAANSVDSDGLISSYLWQQTAGEPSVTLNNASSSVASFIAPSVAEDTVLTFTLTVTDNDGVSDTDTVSVTVLHNNQAPVADAGLDQSVDEDSSVSLSGESSADTDGTIISYLWQQTGGQPAVNLSTATASTTSFTAPTLTEPVTLTFTLIITDNEGAINSDSVDVTINPVNAAPQASAGQDITINEGSSVTLSGSSSVDSDGVISSYLWQQFSGVPSVTINNASSSIASFSAPAVKEISTIIILLTVTDNEGATATDTLTVTINPLNIAPQADAGRNESYEEGSNVMLSGEGSSDPDGIISRYFWRQISGPDVVLSDTNAAVTSFSAPSVTEDTVLSFSLTVTDDEGASDTDQVDVIITDINNDLDGDGLTDAEEAELGTDPANPDSDGDGLSDGDEVNIYTTDPLNIDTDNDGFSDYEEVAQGTSPIDSSSVPYADRVKWSYETGGVIFSSPAIAPDGTVYIGSADHLLYALNPDGSLKWTYETGARVFSAPVIAADGSIYVGSDDNTVYALNPDGSLKWTYTTGGSISSSPALAPDGGIYVGSDDNALYALDPDGSLKWSYSTGFLVSSSPAVASDGTIYVGSYDNALYALNADGSLKWSFQTGDWVFSSPAIAPDGTIYVGSIDHSLYAIDPDGNLKWTYPTGDRIFSSPSVAADGTVYVGSLDNHLYALNPDGSLKWTYETGWIERSSPAIAADGSIYVGSYDGALFALNNDGSLKWSFATGGPVTPSAAIASDGTVFIGSHDTALYALNDDNGGLAPSGWPKFGGNNQNTANVNSGQSTAMDFDGDGRADVAVRRPETTFWYVTNSSLSNYNSDQQDGIQRVRFGLQSDYIPTPGDYDGDGITDFAVRSPSNAYWYIRNSSGNNFNSDNNDGIQRIRFGLRSDDIPVPADYDGDGKTDIAVRRPASHYWYILNSSGVDPLTGNEDGISRVRFGRSSMDIPVPADYDGDGKADLAVRRPENSTWYILNSTGMDTITGYSDGITRRVFGHQAEDIPIPADYDGDKKADLAVRRPSTQTWYVLNSSGLNYNSERQDGIQRVQFGRDANDIPIVADYDGDGIADFAVRRASSFYQYILNSSGQDPLTGHNDAISRLRFGKRASDIPVAAPVSARIEMLNTVNQQRTEESKELFQVDNNKDEFGLELKKVKTADLD